LQARVLPARSEVLTTLIAQTVRFARPNIQIYDAHVIDLYQWVCARYLVGVKVQLQKQARLEFCTRLNFRTDHAGFQPKILRLYFKNVWRRECQSTPLKDKVFSTFLDQNPPFELQPQNGV